MRREIFPVRGVVSTSSTSCGAVGQIRFSTQLLEIHLCVYAPFYRENLGCVALRNSDVGNHISGSPPSCAICEATLCQGRKRHATRSTDSPQKSRYDLASDLRNPS